MGRVLTPALEVAGFDTAFAHLGICKARVLLPSLEIQPYTIELVDTEKQTGKTVRKNSDDLRRARELRAKMTDATKGCAFYAAEIPSGAQSARAAFTFGIVLGLVAGIEEPLIQVSPLEVKMATVGKKTATKEEMIEWAFARYPDLDWLRHGASKHPAKLTAANEHLADAIAVIHAMVQTAQFKTTASALQQIGALAA